MAITKTNFINYTRCSRYAALEEVKKERLDADISILEYKKEEELEILKELIDGMYESDNETEEEIDLIDVKNPQLEAMMPYYKQVEVLATRFAQKHFGGKTVGGEDTFKQVSFDFSRNGIKYLSYTDIYNEEVNGNVNIIEVKATTSNKFLNITIGKRGEAKYPLFVKKDGIYYLKDEVGNDYLKETTPEDYEVKKAKLFDRYKEGKYIFDLAIQRYFIENEYKESKNENYKNIKYYLAVLNRDYIYDGVSDYDVDVNGNEIISVFDFTKVTENLMPYIDDLAKKLEYDLFNLDASPCKLGASCEFKKMTQCKYFKVCGEKIPKYNSSLSYMNNGFGFKNPNGDVLKGLDLINEGYVNLMDIPEEWIKNPNHIIQRNAYLFDTPYIDKEKLKVAIEALKYPIYHLDFETMPCPIPRFKGEKCYTQSPFEFSLHIEHAPGVCDKDQDNFVFLASTFNDEREDLVKALCEHIDPDKGCVFAQNVSFEKSRIKELANIFPEYKEKLMKMYDNATDLLYIIRNNSKFYQELGYDTDVCRKVNYYHKNLSGSYSIKKTLPIFSDLSYANLDVKNGTEAIIEYANYNKMSKEELNLKRQALITYCKQDTWAMVAILDALRKLVN